MDNQLNSILKIAMEKRHYLGYHLLVEMYNCDVDRIKEANNLHQALLEFAKRRNFEIKYSYFYQFTPYGVSGVIVVSESHITVHTWPEYRFLALDVFVCSDNADVLGFVEDVFTYVKATVVEKVPMFRGVKRKIKEFAENHLKAVIKKEIEEERKYASRDRDTGS